MAAVTVTRIGEGVYRVEIDGRAEIVYVAGPRDARWAFWNGRVFREPFDGDAITSAGAARGQRSGPQVLAAPMPATVLKVLVSAGAAVKKGEPVIILEAMKMELPLRAPSDATIKAVHCREGELVQPDAVLVEFDSLVQQ